jgi:hypothetical protein
VPHLNYLESCTCLTASHGPQREMDVHCCFGTCPYFGPVRLGFCIVMHDVEYRLRSLQHAAQLRFHLKHWSDRFPNIRHTKIYTSLTWGLVMLRWNNYVWLDPPHLSKHVKYNTKVKVKATLRLTVSQSVVLVSSPNLGTFDQNPPPPATKLLFCLFGAPSLTRGRVCHVSVFVIEVYHSLVYLQQHLHLKFYTCYTQWK